jgi:CPA2 family monovalent cation:H+ antiporter-2
MDTSLLVNVTVISGVALTVVLVCHRFGIPTIVGFLLTGALAGPHGLRLTRDIAQVEQLAEIGVICLLFTIGMEFSFKDLLRIRTMGLVGGGVQMLLGVAAGAALASVLGMSWTTAAFFGCLVSLSSTAIVLKLLQQRADVESPHGRISLAILIFQDIMVVPMILATPMLAGAGTAVFGDLMWILVKLAGIAVVVAVASKWVVPWGLYYAARFRDRELFTLGVVFFGVIFALAASAAGLSLALGAFFAGIIIAESEYKYHALGNILPFRDFFTSFFFVSVGMLLDIQYLMNNLFMVVGVAILLILAKFAGACLSAMALGYPAWHAILTGLALSQIGEFSFVLSKAGIDVQLMDPAEHQLFLAVSVLTMMATPFLVAEGDRIASTILKLPLPQRLKSGLRRPSTDEEIKSPSDHLIIVGYGLNGRNLAQAADALKIPHIIIELNPETVRRSRAEGQPIIYGDASHEAVLEHAGIKSARLLVIVVSDPTATKRIIDTARRLNLALHIISRTRFITEMGALYQLGADEVIPEDYEVSVEVLTRVLSKYLIPREDIERCVAQVRADHYRMLSSPSYEAPTLADLQLSIPEIEISAIRVCRGSAVAGKTLSELDLRRKFGVTLLAIRRDSAILANISGEQSLAEDDIAILMGRPERISDAASLFCDSGGACVTTE